MTNELTLRTDVGPGLSLSDLTDKARTFESFLHYCTAVAVVRDSAIFSQVPAGNPGPAYEIELDLAGAVFDSQLARTYGYRRPGNSDVETLIGVVTATEGFEVRRFDYNNPWETVIEAVSSSGGPPVYALTGLIIAKQVLKSVMQWQEHRIELAKKRFELDLERSKQRDLRSLAPRSRNLDAAISDTSAGLPIAVDRLKSAEQEHAGEAGLVPKGIDFDDARKSAAAKTLRLGRILKVEMSGQSSEERPLELGSTESTD